MHSNQWLAYLMIPSTKSTYCGTSACRTQVWRRDGEILGCCEDRIFCNKARASATHSASFAVSGIVDKIEGVLLENFNLSTLLNIDVREGASGASADAPGVGLEMVSGLKLLKKDEKMKEKDEKKNIIRNSA